MASGRCPTHAPRSLRDPDYAETRRWFKLVAWQRLRAQVLREQPFCVVCLRHGRRMVATDVDHIVPHRGNAALFWDRNNLQSLDKACHAIKTTRGE